MNAIRECLMLLLTDIERIGDLHEELFDSEVRELAGEALMEAFVRKNCNYEIPETLGMLTYEANGMLRSAIIQFVECANPICEAECIILFHERLALLQDNNVRTESGSDYDDFIGHTPPDWYDAEGNVLWDRVR